MNDHVDSAEPAGPPGDRERGGLHHRTPLRSSLAGRITAAVIGVLVLMALLAAAASQLRLEPWLVFLLTLLVGIPLGAVLVRRILRPLEMTLSGLRDGISSLNDGDLSLRLATARKDELGDLARLYNRATEILQEERHELRQKELLLQTALDRSPVAILLISPARRVIFSNSEARRLLLGGARLEGLLLDEIHDRSPEEMREMLASARGGVFTVDRGEAVETYHLSHRGFRLNRQHHRLVLLHRITAELGRREAAIWKKVIRVISHELNNSIAPISSLLHSARLLLRRPDRLTRADEILATVKERVGDLAEFIEGYAGFARLPEPARTTVDWSELLQSLHEYPFVEVEGLARARPGWADPAQIRQLLVNLVNNAVEASGSAPQVTIRVSDASDGGTFVQVLDRGIGMDEQTMTHALLPFYSTKKTGTGLGLALCREIVEAHGGKISLQPRPEGGTIVSCWLPDRTERSAC